MLVVSFVNQGSTRRGRFVPRPNILPVVFKFVDAWRRVAVRVGGGPASLFCVSRGVDGNDAAARSRDSRVGTAAVGRRAMMKSWASPCCGDMRCAGSHCRHDERKCTNLVSSHLRTCCSVFELTRRRLPLVDTKGLGRPRWSNLLVLPYPPHLPKKIFALVHRSSRAMSGGPKISMMHASCSCSFSPGKIG